MKYKCMVCGREIGYKNCWCSSACRRKYTENNQRDSEIIRKMIKEEGQSMIDPSIRYRELRTEINRRTGIRESLISKVLIEMAKSNYFRLFPNVHSDSRSKVAYLNNRESAAALYAKLRKEEFDELPDVIQTIAYRKRERVKRLEPKIIDDWKKGMNIRKIQEKHRVSDRCIREAISKYKEK